MARDPERTIKVEIPGSLNLSTEQVDEILRDLRGKLVHTMSSATVAVYEKAKEVAKDVPKAEIVKEVAQENPQIKEVTQ